MFGYKQPAENINILLDYLRSSDTGDYCYRGQIKHYEMIIPSIYRSSVVAKKEKDNKMYEINAEVYSSNLLLERNRIRKKLRLSLIHNLGVGVGNIIAQQYGLNSESLDITSDIDIAAFFATRKYPDYTHYSGTRDNQIGVIYRFPLLNNARDIESLEYKLNGFGHFSSDLKQEIWFAKHIKANSVNIDTKRMINQYFDEFGREQMELFSHPIMLDYQTLKDFVIEALKKGYNFFPKAFDETRLARQKGGFITSPVYWRCSIPKKRKVIQREYLLDRNYYEPDTVIAENIKGISGIENMPNIEVFYFKHSNIQISKYTTEYLWPSVIEDEVYDLIVNMCDLDHQASSYIRKENIHIDNSSKGIIDRGYSRGDEDIIFSAMKYYQEEDYENAIELLKKAIVLDPNNSSSHITLGCSYFKLKQYCKAKKCFEKAILANPRNWNGYLNLSTLYTELGNLEEALKVINKSLKYNDRYSGIFHQRAIVYMYKMEYEKALADLEKALQVIMASGKAGVSLMELSTNIHMDIAICYYITSDNGKMNAIIEKIKNDINVLTFKQYLDETFRTEREIYYQSHLNDILST